MINAIGSSGDINPMLMIGARLLSEGHRVDFIASPHFEDRVRDFGMRLLPLGSREQYNEALSNPDVWKLEKAFAAVWNILIPSIRQSYDWIIEEHSPGDTLLVGTTLAIGARFAQEKINLPMASVHLSPALMLSAHNTPVSPTSPVPEWMPLAIRSGWVHLFERLVLDPIAAPPLNNLRAELNLAPIRQVMTRWIHSPHLVLCAFPEWFASVQPDWPANSVNCNFPIYKDRSTTQTASDELNTFLNAGSPPVVITAGTAMAFAKPFIEKGIRAAQSCGLRVIVVCAFDEQVPRLPANAMHIRYADFNDLFKRALMVLHHGGIGTSATALAQACPQLVVPFAHDQFDNAKRLERLGVARMADTNGSISSWSACMKFLQAIEVKKKCDIYKSKTEQDIPGEEKIAEVLKERKLIESKFS
jgi:rhamnosyltransferase subunit B